MCDRYHYSTLAYQELDGEPLPTDVQHFSWWLVDNVKPDLVVLLDMDPATALSRHSERRATDKIENRGAAYFQRLRQRFLSQAAADAERFLVVDASGPMEEIHQKILSRVKEEAKKKNLQVK
jgi:dTMP kinase